MAVSDAGGWWPVDKVFAVYLAGIGVLIAANYPRVPEAGWLLAGHALGLALILGAARWGWSAVHQWYPMVYIPLCYKEMALLIPPIRGTDFDAAMARFDSRLWGTDPILWLERIQQPWLSEYLQIIYTLFIASVISVGVWLWVSRRLADFRYYTFLVSLGFLASYIGYFLVPVRGPRFYEQASPLHGLWLFDTLQQVLDRLESAHYDCFPSGHTEMTLIACWMSRRISGRLFVAFCVYTASIMFATVYLRYHYTVDVFAGVLLAGLILLAAPSLYAAGLVRRQDNTG